MIFFRIIFLHPRQNLKKRLFLNLKVTKNNIPKCIRKKKEETLIFNHKVNLRLSNENNKNFFFELACHSLSTLFYFFLTFIWATLFLMQEKLFQPKQVCFVFWTEKIEKKSWNKHVSFFFSELLLWFSIKQATIILAFGITKRSSKRRWLLLIHQAYDPHRWKIKANIC